MISFSRLLPLVHQSHFFLTVYICVVLLSAWNCTINIQSVHPNVLKFEWDDWSYAAVQHLALHTWLETADLLVIGE